jgi:hypothetical protein
MAYLVCLTGADSAVVTDPNRKFKRFTGILSGPGSPGSVPQGPYIDFICDPRTVNWKIGLIRRGNAETRLIGDPRICDHVEVMMEYYSPPQFFGPPINDYLDGTAIWIRKIP